MKNYFTEEEIKGLYAEQEAFERECNDSDYPESAKVVYGHPYEDDYDAIMTEEEIKVLLQDLDDDIPF